ncbi:MAG TPA: OmpA family protein [Myxococcota bacterium]|nr:OmpA family protein [Myxococcota bacterium]
MIGPTLTVALALGTANAQGLSVDVELMRPTFSAGGPPGIESPLVSGRGAMRGGIVSQYQRDPVILYQFGEEYGVVVKNRASAHFGLAYDLSDRIVLRGVFPVALQVGYDNAVADMSWNGLGMGDLSAGAKVRLATAGPLTTGVRLDVFLPSGTNEAWIGDANLRTQVGLSALVAYGPGRLLADVSYTARPGEIDTGQDFVVESTLDLNGAVAVDVWPERIALQAAYMSRGGVSHLGESGGENGSELLGGVQLLRKDGSGQLDVGVGKGLADGVGTTAFRTFVAYTWIRPPTRREPPPEPVVIDEPPPEPPPVVIEPDIEEPPPEPEWEPEEVAKVVRDQIVIRDPIQFVFAEDTILSESLETLEAIAEILHEHAEIEHLVIEGHASEEGSYEYNYDLSNLRARAIWKELMRNGVHPDRISYRGMGEVVPKDQGTDEESLATNRRVEFHIIDWIEVDEEYPDFPESFRLPWSGDSVETVHPIRPPEPPEKEDKEEVETRVIDLLNPEQFDLYEDEEEEQ